MGLFSFLNKNKQDTTGEDSGYFSRDEDSAATRARSKRASSANEPASPRGKKSRAADDPVLPEKKRARRRLVGAIALALAVAVGLPMLLDAEPKPLASDISIQIPQRDKAPPLPLPAAPGAAVSPSVPPVDSLDRREEIVDAPKSPSADVKPVSLDARDRAGESRAVVKNEPKPAARPAKAQPDSARAADILEGKAAEPAREKFIVQVAALGSAEKVAELQGKLKAAGIHSFTRKVTTPSGERIQVKLGPFSRDEADKMHVRLEKAGLPGAMVRLDVK
jgi:DedD protein